MHESLTENQSESPEKINLEKLNFKELQQLSGEVVKLAETTFEETENRFKNVNGKEILIKKMYDKYVIAGIDNRLTDFHGYLDYNNALREGFTNKEELMQKVRKMIEETGNRIVE